MMELLFKRLAWGDRLAQEERDRIVASVSRVQSFGPGETIVPADTRVDFSSVLLKGLCARQKVLKAGNRQITAFNLAGDFCDLHTYVLKTLPDSVVAMSECEVAAIPHAQLDKIVRDSYHVARLLWASTLIDASVFRQWIVSIGRRSADARLAHLFCELFLRFRMIGLTKDLSYPLAATQTDLADALGLSLVHTNKTCAKLRRADLATFAERTVTIHDWDKLQNFAEFNPEYLHLGVKSAISSQAV
jgi:CRP-like cAMP-binding protein